MDEMAPGVQGGMHQSYGRIERGDILFRRCGFLKGELPVKLEVGQVQALGLGWGCGISRRCEPWNVKA
jgi:hypothetical protein